MKAIAVGNQKGGVGKTTTAVTLGAYLAGRGRRTLIVDLDGQGHVASCLGMEKWNGVWQWLVSERPLDWEGVGREARENLDVVGNDHSAEEVKTFLLNSDVRAYAVAMGLRNGGGGYEVVIIDTPPSTDLLHVAALVASDLVIVPSVMDYLALDGVGYILKSLRRLEKYPNVTAPTVMGILPTMFDRTTVETSENVARLQRAFGNDLVLPPIPRDTKVREAASFGRTIWEYAPKSPAATGFWMRGSMAVNSTGMVGGYLHLGEIVEGWL